MFDNDNLINVKGIGEETIKLLNKLSIFSVWDLITYFPKSFFNFKTYNKIIDNSDENQLISLKVINKEYKGKKGSILTIYCMDLDNNIVELLCFNRNFYEEYAIPNNIIYVFGKFKKRFIALISFLPLLRLFQKKLQKNLIIIQIIN